MIFQNKKLTRLFLGAVAVVATFLFINVFFTYPNFRESLINSIEYSAIRAARHVELQLESSERWSALLQGQPLNAEDRQELRNVLNGFGLCKIKIFSADGVAVYSTDQADVGTRNEYDYFRQGVAAGRVVSKLVEKETESLENQTYNDDVVEVYVPSMGDDQFQGALELYYQMTQQKGALDQIVLFSLLLPLSVAGLLLFALYWGFRNLDQSLLAQAKAEQEIQILRGIIPICMYCKGIRDDAGYWNQIEGYIESHSEAQFSHGICNTCLETHYGKAIADKVNGHDPAA